MMTEENSESQNSSARSGEEALSESRIINNSGTYEKSESQDTEGFEASDLDIGHVPGFTDSDTNDD